MTTIKIFEWIGVMTFYLVITVFGGLIAGKLDNDGDFMFGPYMVSSIIFAIIAAIAVTEGYFGL